MIKEKYIIGIDVYLSRYDACFYDTKNNESKYYTGSLTNNYGKNRLINRISKDDFIIMNESNLAAEFLIKFTNKILIINDEVLSLLSKANISRGSKMASFFVNNCRVNKNKQLSKTMQESLLIEGSKRVETQEKLFDLGINLFDEIQTNNPTDLKYSYELEDKTNDFNNFKTVKNDKIDEVSDALRKFEKLNELLSK
jgi:hypothetical protein